MGKKLKIVAVSYTNTLPFIYGLKHSNVPLDYELDLQTPSVCAKKLRNKEADIGLIPIAAMREMTTNFEIITDYCLGANGAVKTVLLLSNKPKEEIQGIYLDTHSRTSVSLVKILSKFYWNKEYTWQNIDLNTTNESLMPEAVVAIGDKTFELRKKYAYAYDLSEEWYKFTGLPFVFACWATNKPIDEGTLKSLNDALQFGVKNIHEIVPESNSLLATNELQRYLEKDMSYMLDDKKKEAMQKYFNYLNQL